MQSKSWKEDLLDESKSSKLTVILTTTFTPSFFTSQGENSEGSSMTQEGVDSLQPGEKRWFPHSRGDAGIIHARQLCLQIKKKEKKKRNLRVRPKKIFQTVPVRSLSEAPPLLQSTIRMFILLLRRGILKYLRIFPSSPWHADSQRLHGHI